MFKDLALAYFKAFWMEDIHLLRSLFAENVALRDWDVEVHGIESVLKENTRLFGLLNNISVEVLALYEDGQTVVAELLLSADELPSIRVVDVLSFDEHCKIASIRAYKG